MKKIRPVLFCLSFALCALCLGGCTRDKDNGSSESTTSTTETRTNDRNDTNDKNNSNDKNDNNKNDGTESSNGVMEDVKDDVETMIDDAATILDPNN